MKRFFLMLLLVLNYSFFAETITLNSPNGLKKTLEVNADAEKLVVSKEMYVISSIEGLEKLTNLKKVEICFSDLSYPGLLSKRTMMLACLDEPISCNAFRFFIPNRSRLLSAAM